jgi:hypothetical protein
MHGGRRRQRRWREEIHLEGLGTVPDATARYGDAEVRHICKAAIEGPTDPDFGCLHAAHEAWNAMARLELVLIESETAK